MRHLLTLIIASIITIAAFMAVYGNNIDLSFSITPVENSTDHQSMSDTPSDNQEDLEEEDELWFDTVM